VFFLILACVLGCICRNLAFLVRPMCVRTCWQPMEPWCSDCKVTIIYSEPSSPSSRSPPIDLPLARGRSGTNLSSTTCHYNGLLKVYVMLCYNFLSKGPACSAKVSLKKAPLAPCGSQTKPRVIPHSPKQDTQPIEFLISKQVVLYWTRGGTCYPGVSTPKIRHVVDLRNHIT
jgi:hypothetical protein